MADKNMKVPVSGLLPLLVVTPSNVSELRREAEGIDEFMRQTAIRKSGKGLAIPKVGYLLNEVVNLNNLNLLKEEDRTQLLKFLSGLKENAPTVHISFASDPSSAFITKIVAWFRDNVHPQVLLQIGLQPNLAAGCVVRTSNKVFDMSLRQRFLDKRSLLIDELKEKAAHER